MNTIEKALNKKTVVPEEASNHLSVATSVAEENTIEHQPDVSQVTESNSVTSSFEALVEKQTGQKTYSKKVEITTSCLENKGFLKPEDTQSEISEQFRQIKRPILQNIRGKSAHPIERANLIQVTSSLQSEGKTFTAINLALAVAMELDFKVLLVDADILKPSVASELGIEADQGLVEYLSGDVKNLSDVLLKTNISKLSILPAGKRHNLSTELVSSHAMDELFNELSERYSDRVVIIDSSPILQTNESVIISHKVGQIVFVIEQNTTEIKDVEQAVSKLDKNAVIGLVLNKSRSSSTGSYYGYGYGQN